MVLRSLSVVLRSLSGSYGLRPWSYGLRCGLTVFVRGLTVFLHCLTIFARAILEHGQRSFARSRTNPGSLSVYYAAEQQYAKNSICDRFVSISSRIGSLFSCRLFGHDLPSLLFVWFLIGRITSVFNVSWKTQIIATVHTLLDTRHNGGYRWVVRCSHGWSMYINYLKLFIH